MSEGFGVQVSYKFGKNQQHMINVRGEDTSEFAHNLKAMKFGVEELLSFANLLEGLPENGVALLEKELGATVINTYEEPAYRDRGYDSAPPQHYSQEPQQSYGGKVCRHGTMILKSGQGAKGPWSAYMCPAPKGPDQCKPIDAKTGKTWG